MKLAQILAIIVFLVMFFLIILDKIEKHYVTLGCGAVTIIVIFGIVMNDTKAIMRTLNIQSITKPSFWYVTNEANTASTGINWSTIIFLFGMMVMVEGMGKVGFFRWLCLKIAKLVHYKAIPLFVTFMIMSALLAMFIDSITVILFLSAVTVELAKLLKIDPIPMIFSEIFCANLGGSATMCGDPPNIIIGTSLGYSFFDFLMNTGVMSLIGLIVVLIYFYLAYRKELITEEGQTVDVSKIPSPESAISNKRDFIAAVIIFAIAVGLLVTHAMTGLTVAFIGTFIAGLTILVYQKHARELIGKVDYKTLLFFIGLFVVVGGLEETGVLKVIATFIGKASGGNFKLMVAIILWISAIASAFVDNIPFSATMIPIIRSLAAANGVDLATLAWTLSMGTDIGRSATPIGASANVVGIAVAGKEGYPVGWGRYCKKVAPATFLVCLVSMLFIFVRYC